ncbi:MAG TPA: glutamine--tRNA ligase/YqeY domain fusion protein [Trueperaceae bacterium]|nr:glutamine--tRNA ligase/YqeY domain fusion protein [Trueperaceae bacterium]
MTPKGGDAAPADAGRLVSPNFITDIIDRDLEAGTHRRVVTRFPPEPNGYAHIGHAFASFLDFGLAEDYGGACRLRFDDTNPDVEEMRFVTSIEEDMRWLGWRWEGATRFASDYFEQLYGLAERLIGMGDAYVDSLPTEEIQRMRGTVERPGTPSPYRGRPAEENLDLFRRMRAGEFAGGAHVLRAKIDMASANMKLRDPLLYRIVHAEHYRTGGAWCIYPFYDFQHPLSDAIEGVSHSLCSLEFVDNRDLYDWLVDRLFPGRERPRQYEFGRRNLEYTVVSKRRLIRLVNEGHVDGWDDPRMPTLAGLRRRGVRPEAVRDFAGRIGVSRTNRTVDMALLEHSIRDDLNTLAPRVLAVIDPLPVTLTNVEAGETLDAPYWPPDVPREGGRALPFGPRLVIEREDFAEDPPRGYRRLAPGRAVRLRHAYVIRCDEVVKDASGRVTELRCSVLADSLGRNPEGVKVAGAIHWLSEPDALPAEFRLYDRLFTAAEPGAGGEDFLTHLNPASLVVRRGYVEPSVAGDPADTRYQFERLGYFWRDPAAGDASGPAVFIRIVTLKDSWARREASRAGAGDGEPAAAAGPGAGGRGARRASRPRKGTPGVWRTATEASHPEDGVNEEEAAVQAAGLDPHHRGLFERFRRDFGISSEDAAQIAERDDLAGFFEAAVAEHGDAVQVANWVVNDLVRALKGRALNGLGITPERLAHLLRLVDDGTVTIPVARELFTEVVRSGTDPEMLVRERGLERLADEDALREIIARILAEHPSEVAAFRDGKSGLKGFFVGQVMRATQGRADPQLVQRLVGETLGGA